MTRGISRRKMLIGSAGLLGATILPRFTWAEDYPDRPITVALMAPAGGATDRGVRPVCARLKKELKAPAIALQDMSGAGGLQALDFVMSKPTDGYTWVGMNDIIESFLILGRTQITYKDFDFWMSGGTAAGVIVKNELKIKTFEEWVDWVKSGKGELSCSTTPSGSLWANVATFLKKKLDLPFRIIYYKGGGPAVRAVVAGEVDFGCMGITPMANFMRAKKLRCLAATTPEDWEVAGVVIPSMARYIKDKLFVKTLPWTNIHGIALKKGTPEVILKKIDAAFAATMADPSMNKVYEDNAFFPFRAGRDRANDLMRERTELQCYISEVIVKNNKLTREQLGIAKIEDKI